MTCDDIGHSLIHWKKIRACQNKKAKKCDDCQIQSLPPVLISYVNRYSHGSLIQYFPHCKLLFLCIKVASEDVISNFQYDLKIIYKYVIQLEGNSLLLNNKVA